MCSCSVWGSHTGHPVVMLLLLYLWFVRVSQIFLYFSGCWSFLGARKAVYIMSYILGLLMFFLWSWLRIIGTMPGKHCNIFLFPWHFWIMRYKLCPLVKAVFTVISPCAPSFLLLCVSSQHSAVRERVEHVLKCVIR